MSSVLITFEMAEMIAARIASLPRRAREVDGLEVLPLYDDIEGVIGIRPDGTLVEWSHDGGRGGARPVEDRAWVLIALAAGVRRYPELQPLLPIRGKGTVGCACRWIPECVSGLIYCDRCGGMGWLPAGRSRPLDWPNRPGRASSRFAFVFVILAFVNFFGAFVVLTVPSRAFIWNGLTLIGVGILSLVLASHGVVRRRPGRRRIARGPTFTADDPEIAALPPTSMTCISERIRLAREQRERAEE